MIGQIAIWVGFLGAAISAFAYYRVSQGNDSMQKFARNGFAVTFGCTLAASVLLMLYIMQHRFEYDYVWSYSSRDLPTALLITTFWAGQEGSFLLWAFWSIFIGIVLLRSSKKNKNESEVMAVYMSIVAFLLLLVAVKSPFKYIWNVHPNDVTVGQIPNDGRGLNPLLQNFWMLIHPPILFIGFAALAVPFSFAIAALWKKQYQQWISAALPWVLFGALSLGAGLILGGYWAYGVLGWGGWWGWDPVENSSLVPWIVSIILIHSILTQRKTGRLARTNFALAVTGFFLVVYSTFLTRSGILGDSSVHSFVDPGAFAYTLLIVWLVLTALLGFGLLGKRWKDLTSPAGHSHLFSREGFLALASVVMGASALVVFFGTSLPIVSKITVEPSFYDRTNLPLAILMGVLLSFSLLLQWSIQGGKETFKKAFIALGAALVVTIILIIVGLNDWRMILFAYSSLVAFFLNIETGLRLAKQNIQWVGGPIAHVGLALLFLGIIGSGRYGEKVNVSLPLHEQKEALGYTWTYLGSKQNSEGKSVFTIKGERNGSVLTLEPVMYMSSYNNNIMRNPDYVSLLTKDLYLEPVSLEQPNESEAKSMDTYNLKKGEPISIQGVQVTFLRFEMGAHGKDGMMGGSQFGIGAVLEVRKGTKTEQLTPVTFFQGQNIERMDAAMLKDSSLGFQMLKMNINMENKEALVQIQVVKPGAAAPSSSNKEILIVEASVKPFITLVWFGAFCIILGLGISIYRRRLGFES
ncbi:MAG: cytochrome c biogenesis protein CcsA [bacterium]